MDSHILDSSSSSSISSMSSSSLAGDSLTTPQEMALAIVPKCTSALSILSSISIIYEIGCDYRQKRKTTAVQRVLVAMSCVDILASVAWFLSTWAVPEESGMWGAHGNIATCNLQGFLLQLAIGAPLYNSSLALFYLLMIKWRWTEPQLQTVEKWVHASVITFTLGTSFAMLPMGLYNHIGAVCWVIGSPQDCGDSSFGTHEEMVECERGNHAWLYGLFLFYIPLWICVVACAVSMVLLYREVSNTHRASARYSAVIRGLRPSMGRSGQDPSRVALQAILYCLSFIVTWTPSTLWSIAHWFPAFGRMYGLDIAAAAAEPLQGFWNFLIFCKSRPRTIRKIQRQLAYWCPCCFKAPRMADASSNSNSQRSSIWTSVGRLSQLSGRWGKTTKKFGRWRGNNNGMDDTSEMLSHSDVKADIMYALRDLDLENTDYGGRGPMPDFNNGGDTMMSCELGMEEYLSSLPPVREQDDNDDDFSDMWQQVSFQQIESKRQLEIIKSTVLTSMQRLFVMHKSGAPSSLGDLGEISEGEDEEESDGKEEEENSKAKEEEEIVFTEDEDDEEEEEVEEEEIVF